MLRPHPRPQRPGPVPDASSRQRPAVLRPPCRQAAYRRRQAGAPPQDDPYLPSQPPDETPVAMVAGIRPVTLGPSRVDTAMACDRSQAKPRRSDLRPTSAPAQLQTTAVCRPRRPGRADGGPTRAGPRAPAAVVIRPLRAGVPRPATRSPTSLAGFSSTDQLGRAGTAVNGNRILTLYRHVNVDPLCYLSSTWAAGTRPRSRSLSR